MRYQIFDLYKAPQSVWRHRLVGRNFSTIVSVNGTTITLDELFEPIAEQVGSGVDRGTFLLTSIDPLVVVWVNEHFSFLPPLRKQSGDANTTPVGLELVSFEHRITVANEQAEKYVAGCATPSMGFPEDCEHRLIAADIDYTQYDHVKIVFDEEQP